MTTLVIGSSGYMGRHLMAGLAAAGLTAKGASSTDGTGLHPSTGLFPEEFSVKAGTSTVVYLAQSPRYRETDQAHHVLAVNVLSAVRAAVSARAAGVKRFVYISTGTVYAPSFLPLTEDSPVEGVDWYTVSKLQGEQAVKMFSADMEVHVVRPFGVYGPGQQGRLVPNLIASIRAGRPITLQGRQDDLGRNDGLRISLCHIDDATNILLHLIKNGGPACLNMAGDQAISIRQLATTIGNLIGVEPNFIEADNYRKFDLVADTNLLSRSQSHNFVKLLDGLETAVML